MAMQVGQRRGESGDDHHDAVHDPDWVRAHESLLEVASSRAELEWREGTLLLEALRTRVHTHFGFASFAQYVEQVLGYKPRTTEEKLRTAVALESLPETSRALREGALHWSAARELTRVATAKTEKEWLEVADRKTLRQIEDLVSGRSPGDRPGAPQRAGAKKHVLRLEVSAETLATFREAVAHLRRKSPDRLDDDALLLQMARECLQGPGDEGRSS